ncbi:PKD domain-containing protein [Pontiellaceae bacterium B12219]|nr:PKD domain-containing protein [Pontiellaceae bacterium B12219]
MKKIFLSILLCGAVSVSHGALVGEWTFDEGAGTTVANSALTGSQYDGTIEGSTAWVPGHDGGYALDFSAVTNTGNYVLINSPDFLDTVSNQISIAFWSYSTTTSGQQTAAFQGSVGGAANNREIQSHLPYGTTVYWDCGYNRLSSGGVDSSLYLESGNWVYWVFTKNSDTGDQKVYANGQVVMSTTNGTEPIDGVGVSTFTIGSKVDGTLSWPGYFDDFQVYDHELTLSEIAIGYDPNIIAPVIVKNGSVGQSPFEVIFDASESVAGNGVAEYLWDFGEDTNMTVDATGVVVTNSFVTEGSHTITLYVVDNIGATNSVATSITVDNPFWSTNLPPMVYVRENWATTNYPSASSNDLAETTALNYITGGVLSNQTNYLELFDGLVGTADDVTPTGFVRMYVDDSITVEFDTSSAPYGFDLTQVRTIMGWGTAAGGRSNQGYDLIVTYVDDTTETIAGWKSWNPNVPTTYWTGVMLEAEESGSFVSGVKAVTIKITQPAVPGGWVLAREFDIFGTPTVIVEGPTITGALVSGGTEMALSWGSVAGASYTVQRSENLVTGPWVDTAYKAVPAMPPSNVYTAAVDSASAEFFQVIIE